MFSLPKKLSYNKWQVQAAVFFLICLGAQGQGTVGAPPETKKDVSALAGLTKTIAAHIGHTGARRGGDGLSPTYADIAYGPHERNKLDFWRADSEPPAPLVVFIHGGGFVGGDKSELPRGEKNRLQRCLDNGVSAASINYPFVLTTNLLEIIHGASRAIQFLRSQAADWNIDKARVAVYGESAGAGTALWLAFHDDLADPANDDPVLRESTRILAAGAIATQATYDFSLWPKYLVLPPWLWDTSKGIVCPMYYHMEQDQLESEEGIKMLKDLDMLSFIDASDPPVYLRTNRDVEPPKTWDHMLHHPGHALKVRDACREQGIECVLIEKSTPQTDRVDVIDFLFNCLGVKPKTS